MTLALGLIVLLITPVLAASTPTGEGTAQRALAPYRDDDPGTAGEQGEPTPAPDEGEASVARFPTGVGRPGVYAARDVANLDPATYHIVGAHQAFDWKDLEPTQNSYNWAALDDFIRTRAALGKPIGIGIMTYTGRQSQAAYGQSACKVPDYVFQLDPGAKVICSSGGMTMHIPKYWNNTYKTRYQALVNALANHLRGNPSLDQHVEFIYMGVGSYGESQPCDDEDNACLRNAGLTSDLWYQTVNEITNMYKSAFQSGGYYKNLVLLSSPVFQSDNERKQWSLHAMGLGVGLGPAALYADKEWVDLRTYVSGGGTSFYGRGQYDYILEQAEQDNYQYIFPVAHEAYADRTPDPTSLWWGVLGALSRHADYITAERNLLYTGDPGGSRPPITGNHYALDFANKYLGKTLANTPGVWVVMRESTCPDSMYPQKGNYVYWLKQDDAVSGGATQAVTWMSGALPHLSPTCISSPNTRILYNQTQLLGPSGEEWAESLVCRRTKQAQGQNRMFFRVHDSFIYGGSNAVTIRVRYYDLGTDTWVLKYDGATSREQSTVTVNKTNSRTWTWATFNISDARFMNGQPYGSPGTDFYIDNRGDGDEYIHMVEVLRSGGLQSYDIPLSAGANLISLPLTPPDLSTTAVFNPIWSYFQKVFAYDIGGTWKSYDKSKPINTLTTLDTTMGLWLYVSSACTLTINGTPTPQSNISLRGPDFGNIVGYPSRTERSLSDAFGSVFPYVSKVVEFTGASAKSYNRGVPVNPLTSLKPGHGYIIYVDQNCTWTVNP